MAEAAAAPQIATETTFKRQYCFSGKVTHGSEKEDLSPYLFVREITNCIAKYGWSEETTMNNVATMLSGDAAEWFHRGLPTERSLPGFEGIRKSWTKFLPIFRANFNIEEDIYNLSVNSALDSQRKSETPLAYVQRIILAMADFEFARYSEGQRAPANQEGCMLARPVPPRIVTKLETEANLQEVDLCIANGEFRGALDQYRILIDAMTQRVIACGFLSSALREEASKLLATKPDLAQFAASMRKVIRQKEAASHLAAQRPLTKAKVAEVNSAQDEDEAENDVNAIKKTDDGRNSNSNSNFKKNLKCHYCKRKGHFLIECRTRLANEAKKAKDAASKASSATSNGPPVPPLAAIASQSAGNALGPW